MGNIRLATLVQTLDEAGKGLNQAVRGIVATDSGEVEAHVKVLDDSRRLIVECLCAIVGRQMQLPIPEPLLVLVRAADGSAALAFGSVSQPAPDLHTLLSLGQHALIDERLSQWPSLVSAGCFDEWVANADRNQQNILFDGKHGFWLIDHERCIPPTLPPADPLAENPFLKIASFGKEERDLLTTRAKVAEQMRLFREVVTAEVAANFEPAKTMTGGHETENLVAWLAERQNHLVRLGTARIPARQAGLLDG